MVDGLLLEVQQKINTLENVKRITLTELNDWNVLILKEFRKIEDEIQAEKLAFKAQFDLALREEQRTAYKRHKEHLLDLMAQFKRACLKAKEAVSRQQRGELEELLGRGGGDGDGGDGESELDQLKALETAESICQSLQRSRSTLSTEVLRSTATLNLLTQSSMLIEQSQGQQRTLAGHAQHGHRVLAHMDRRERNDLVFFGLGVVFFFMVVIYILCRRMFRFNPFSFILFQLISVDDPADEL